ncbi:MAG: hypothetical protein CM1200mP29_06030 [Verrucomicrobiota bacterium]|nr:MAG: hypothetical protein CM1200mP29_06030 [Verrucomicrobiota bacterium]
MARSKPGAPHERRGGPANNFNEPILGFIEQCSEEFAQLTGRRYGLLHDTSPATPTRCSSRLAARRKTSRPPATICVISASQGGIDPRQRHTPLPRGGGHEALRGKKTVIILERTDEGMAGDNPLTRDIRTRWARGRRRLSSAVNCRPSRRRKPRAFSAAATASAHATSGRSTRSARTSLPQAKPNAPTAKAPRTARPIYAGHHPPVRSHLEGHTVPTAKRRDRGAVPLDRRLGHDHPRQKPWRDHRQFWARLFPSAPRPMTTLANWRTSSSSWPIRSMVGKKGRADELLPDRGAGVHPGELRLTTWTWCCAATPRRSRNEPARGHQQGRLPRMGIERLARGGVETHTGQAPAVRQGQQHRDFYPARFRCRPRRHQPRGSSVAHAGQLVPRRILQGVLLPQGSQISEGQYHDIVHKQYEKKFGASARLLSSRT